MSAALSPDEIERYSRHILLREIGGPGQARLKASRILVIGAGGLGAPLLQYLAAAGIGTLGIVDDDTVSLSNLQRQIIYGTDDIGQFKAETAARAISRINPHLAVIAYKMRVEGHNLADLIANYDVVADGSDNFDTRYAVADACSAAGKPLVTAALGTFDATLTTLRPFERDAHGAPNPTYRCLFPAPPPAGAVPTCAEAGVLGALAGVMGSLMALEVIRAVVPFGEPLVGRLLMVDARAMRFDEIAYARADETET
jgi:molybdopterin/thiamine biosynthesis adenylyltransferase